MKIPRIPRIAMVYLLVIALFILIIVALYPQKTIDKAAQVLQQAPIPNQISSVELTSQCQVKITEGREERVFPTQYSNSDECKERFKYELFSDNKAVVYTDKFESGGSRALVYSAETDTAYDLVSFEDEQIYQLEYQDGIGAILKGNPGQKTILFYKLDKIIDEIPAVEPNSFLSELFQETVVKNSVGIVLPTAVLGDMGGFEIVEGVAHLYGVGSSGKVSDEVLVSYTISDFLE